MRADDPAARPWIAESEKTVTVNERMVRSELSATVSAVPVQNKSGIGKVWQAKIVFESSERGCVSWGFGALVCVAVLGLAMGSLACNYVHRLHGQNA